MRIPFTNIHISLPKRTSARAELDKVARQLQAEEAERIRRGLKGQAPTEASLRRGRRLAKQTEGKWKENRENAGSRESIW